MLNKTAEALRRNRYEVSVFETHEEALQFGRQTKKSKDFGVIVWLI